MNETNNNNNKPIPWRFSELSFRRYEPIIAQAVTIYPDSFTINARVSYELSPITFACRFRDAMKSYKIFGWVSTLIDRDKFMSRYTEIAISEISTPGLLTIGDKKQLKKPSVLQVHPAVSMVKQYTSSNHEPINITTEEEFDLICKLASGRLLSSEIKIKSTNQTQDLQTLKTKYEQQYDVSVEYDIKTGIASVI